MQNRQSAISGRVAVAQDRNHLNEIVSDLIAKQLAAKPESAIGLPTGKSVMGAYEILARRSSEKSAQKQIDWSKAKCFALDDYLDVEESFSFQTFLKLHLYQFTNVKPDACFNPRFHNNYDQLIADAGGLDLCVLGLGGNGHIAFNEPDTPKNSWTHCLWLSEATKLANRDYFQGSQKKASLAITMGISTILASAKIVLVATGRGKKEILKRVLLEEVSPLLPASFLVPHPNLVVVTDFHYQDL
jgi:glucosamine-6-phosphate deaminase